MNLTQRQVMAFTGSEIWQEMMRELDARRDQTQQALNSPRLQRDGDNFPLFDSLQDQGMYLRGALEELDWIKALPGFIAEDAEVEEKENE